MPAGGLRCGDRRLDADALETAIDSARPGEAARGRLLPIRDADPAQAVVRALAARRDGAVPLLGDDRWSDAHWRALSAGLARQPMPADAAWATFTSGSTGAPRILVRSDASWRDAYAHLDAALGLGPGADETVLLPVSLLSSMTVSSIAHAAAIGASIVLPRRHALAAADLVDATWAHTTPLGLSALVALLDAGAATRLRVVQVGGAALDPALRARAEAHGLRLVAYYGSAELSYLAIDDDGAGLRPFPGVELRGDGAGGLLARSPYAALEARDADGRIRWTPRPDGWAASGDAVRFEPDGEGMRLRVLGRRDGAVLTAAATVHPEHVEAAYDAVPGVRGAVALGLPHPRLGALVALVVEVERGVPLAELRRIARDRLPRSHWPRRWYRIDALPRTASGKPARAELARLAAEGALAPYDRGDGRSAAAPSGGTEAGCASER